MSVKIEILHHNQNQNTESARVILSENDNLFLIFAETNISQYLKYFREIFCGNHIYLSWSLFQSFCPFLFSDIPANIISEKAYLLLEKKKTNSEKKN